ncbi:MAG: AbrB/MazE/SpoVT family DNA-binding domain-containing protein [Candidatus Competibacteraceae bacterium]
MTEKNLVAIPTDLAHELNIKAGTRLEWTRDQDGMLRARPLPSRGELADHLMGAGRQWLKPGDDPIAELVAERARENEQEDRS